MTCFRLARALARQVVLVASCVLPGVLWAADGSEDWLRNPSISNYKAYAEFKMANYAEAKAIWQVLAERDNSEALFNLAILAEDGLGEAQDMSRALSLYQRSALAGGSKAQYRLGLLYSAGGPVPRDLGQARRFLSMAADGGDDDARRRLDALGEAGPATGFARAETLSGQGRHAEAAAIYRELAGQGDAKARTRLAWLHEAGRGVPRDLAEAARLFRLSAEAGEAEAQYALAVMLDTGRGQVQDRAESRRWLERSAQAGFSDAQQALRERSLR
ncbi:MAG TPA: tetratricopeptide repeat protein [Rhodocyclaceae bacterium]